jgi:hypothetical protein
MREMTPYWLVFLAFVAAGFAVLEAYGWYRYGTAGTLSAHVRVWSAEHPTIIFALGALTSWAAYHFWNAADMAAVAASVH